MEQSHVEEEGRTKQTNKQELWVNTSTWFSSSSNVLLIFFISIHFLSEDTKNKISYSHVSCHKLHFIDVSFFLVFVLLVNHGVCHFVFFFTASFYTIIITFCWFWFGGGSLVGRLFWSSGKVLFMYYLLDFAFSPITSFYFNLGAELEI